MSSQANNITAINSKKPTAKQEIIAANVKLLIEQLEAGHSEAGLCWPRLRASLDQRSPRQGS